MILWLTGNTGAGKTTLARRLAGKNTVVLDGDDLRRVWPGLTMEKQDRLEQCRRVARLAHYLEGQGLAVIVAVIAPYQEFRTWAADTFNIKFLYIPGGERPSATYPYELPFAPDAVVNGATLWEKWA